MAKPVLKSIELIPEAEEISAGYKLSFEEEVESVSARYVVQIDQFTHGKRERHKTIEQLENEGLEVVKRLRTG